MRGGEDRGGEEEEEGEEEWEGEDVYMGGISYVYGWLGSKGGGGGYNLGRKWLAGGQGGGLVRGRDTLLHSFPC